MLSSPAVRDVPVEATAFLGAVAAFVIFLFVFFLYLNKRLCFDSSNNASSDESSQRDPIKGLGEAYNYHDYESSSDSEDFNRRLSSCSFSSNANREHHLHNYHQLGPSSKSSSFFSEKQTDVRAQAAQTDLISLAEKGKAETICDPPGVGVSSSSSSSSSGSTTSADDDLLTHRTLRHRDPRAYRQMSPTPLSSPLQEIFDDSDLAEVSLIVKCGFLETGFAYDLPTRTLTVHILQAKDIPLKDRGGAIHCQVRILLLPRRKSKKTKIKPGLNPQFNEAFVFTKINPDDLSQLALRLRLYGCERMRKEHMIGEAIVPFSSVNVGIGNSFWVTLEPRASTLTQLLPDDKVDVCSLPRSDSTGSTHSAHGGFPELLLGLSYNGVTGQLTVEIIKGSRFRTGDEFKGIVGTKKPDSYVKLRLVSSTGQEIAHTKSSVRRGQPNPLFKEAFIFQVPLFQLPDVTLMVSVYAKRNIKRKDLIGWFSLGYNSSGEDESCHWIDMRDSQGQQISRWHSLLES